MGLNLNNFKKKKDNLTKVAKKGANYANEKALEMKNKPLDTGKFKDKRKKNRVQSGFGDEDESPEDEFNNIDENEEYPIQQTQKPESFFHFLLDNKFRDLEMSIRGVKDVWDKDQDKFVTKRKGIHCFTDEEAEEILRTVQVHLSTDIKLSNIRMDSFPVMMDAIFTQISFLFFTIADYQYGRYGSMENQFSMKRLNLKIFLEVMTRIQANYSMAVGARENTSIHGSVKGQESLNNTDRDISSKKWSY